MRLRLVGHPILTTIDTATPDGTLTLSTSAFKARCLEILKALEARKLTRVVVTRRGRPVAEARCAPQRLGDGGARRPAPLTTGSACCCCSTPTPPFGSTAGRRGGEAALTAIGEVAAGPGVLLSPVGAWEIGFLVAKGRTALDLPAPVWIARHEAASRNPDSKQDFVPVYICHGWDKQWARQAFHNLNTLGVRPNAALSIGMDARDPITRICRTVERGVPLFKDRVNKVRRQLRTGDAHIVTITTLRGACVTLAKGISGVQYGARPYRRR